MQRGDVERRHGNLAGNEVRVVVPHKRDEQVGIVDAGVKLHRRIRSVAFDDEHLRRQHLGKMVDGLAVFLDDDDAVILFQHHGDEELRRGTSSADNDQHG